MDKISIIVPVFNSAAFLSDCIKSIVNQTYTNLEIILIDDGSKDNSGSICDSFAKDDPRIIVIHQDNSGVSSSRNTGIARASGSYIAFVDSDDLIAPDMIKLLHSSLVENQCDISTCGFVYIYQTESLKPDTTNNTTEILTGNEAIENMLYRRNIGLVPFAKLYKIDLFNEIRFSEKLRMAEDADVNYKIFSKARNIAVNSLSQYDYVQHPQSVMHEKFSLKRMDGLIVMKSIYSDAKDHHPAIVGSAENRLFIEAIFIATVIPLFSFQYRAQLHECLNVIKTLHKNILNNTGTRKRYRQYAMISLFSTRLLIMLLKLRAYTRKISKAE